MDDTIFYCCFFYSCFKKYHSNGEFLRNAREFCVIHCDEDVQLLLTEEGGGIYRFEGKGVQVCAGPAMDVLLVDLPTLHT